MRTFPSPASIGPSCNALVGGRGGVPVAGVTDAFWLTVRDRTLTVAALVSQPLPVRRNAQSDSHMGFPTTLFIIIIRPYQQTVSKAYQKRIKSVSTLYQSMAIVRGSRPCDASEVRMSRNRTASGGPTDNKPPSARQCAQYLSKRWCGSGHWLCKSCGCARSESALALLGSERQQRRHGQRSDRAQSIV
jgi:hypothetical protein